MSDPDTGRREIIIPNPHGLLARLQHYIDEDAEEAPGTVDSGSQVEDMSPIPRGPHRTSRMQIHKHNIKSEGSEMSSSVYTEQVISVDLSGIFRTSEIEIGDGPNLRGIAAAKLYTTAVSSETNIDLNMKLQSFARNVNTDSGEIVLQDPAQLNSEIALTVPALTGLRSHSHAHAARSHINNRKPAFSTVLEDGTGSVCSSPKHGPSYSSPRDTFSDTSELQPLNSVIGIVSTAGNGSKRSSKKPERRPRGVDVLELGGRWEDARPRKTRSEPILPGVGTQVALPGVVEDMTMFSVPESTPHSSPATLNRDFPTVNHPGHMPATARYQHSSSSHRRQQLSQRADPEYDSTMQSSSHLTTARSTSIGRGRHTTDGGETHREALKRQQQKRPDDSSRTRNVDKGPPAAPVVSAVKVVGPAAHRGRFCCGFVGRGSAQVAPTNAGDPPAFAIQL